MEVYVNNIIGNSGNSNIDAYNDVPAAPVINDAMEITEVDETVDDETVQVDDDGIPTTEDIEQKDMPVFGYFNLESNLETNGSFTAFMGRVQMDQEEINAGGIKFTIPRMPHLTYRHLLFALRREARSYMTWGEKCQLQKMQQHL
jgi:hypothetical protein